MEGLPSDGTAELFVARRIGTRDLVLLKRLPRSLRNNVSADRRFAREAEVAARLDHPNLVLALDRGRAEDGMAYVVTELVLGCTLRTVLTALSERGERLPLLHFVTVADAVLKGLDFAHEAKDVSGRPLGIVHRNLSPEHILVTLTGDVRIKDFAVARARTGDFKTAVGLTVGSAAYLSPEQARGYPLDGRSDLFTLGSVFHEMLSGRPVVTEGDLVDMIRFVLEQNPPRLRTERADAPAALDEALRVATAKSPRDRYGTAEEMRQAVVSASGLKAVGPDRDAFGAFVRALLPEEERRVVGLLRRVRKKATRLSLRAEDGLETAAAFDGEDTEDIPDLRTVPTSYDEGPPESSVVAVSDMEKTSSYDVRPGFRAGVTRWSADLLDRIRVRPAVIIGVLIAVVGATAWLAGGLVGLRSRAPEAASPVRRLSRAADQVVRADRAAAADPLADQLAALRENPNDIEAFDRLHTALLARLSGLPPPARASIEADLDAAERAFDIELLARALWRLRRVPGGADGPR